jgi:hypothetical protein
MANPKKIQPGTRVKRFPAGTFNALVEGELRDRQAAHKGNPTPSGGASKSSIIVKLWWQGETPIGPGSVVKLGEPINSPTGKPWVPLQDLQFRCTTPTSADADEPFAIALEPIRAGELGYAHIPQACWALVNVTDEAHTFAKIGASTEFQSNAATGHRILWKETGPGAGKWAVVNLSAPGGSRLIAGVVIATIPAASSLVTGSLPSYVLTHTHGYAANAVILMRRKSDGSGWEADLDEDDNPLVVGGVNHAMSRLRGSPASPVALLGYVETLTVSEEDVQAFVPANWDNRSLFGLDKANHQGPYHADASDEFVLGAEDCTPVAP